jgi:hypothetical protein
LQTDGGC